MEREDVFLLADRLDRFFDDGFDDFFLSWRHDGHYTACPPDSVCYFCKATPYVVAGDSHALTALLGSGCHPTESFGPGGQNDNA